MDKAAKKAWTQGSGSRHGNGHKAAKKGLYMDTRQQKKALKKKVDMDTRQRK